MYINLFGLGLLMMTQMNMTRENKLTRIQQVVEKSKNIELKANIFAIIKQYNEKYTTTRTNILINLSWACDNCIEAIYTLVSNVECGN